MKFEWECIFCEEFSKTERARVGGGWIVKHSEFGRSGKESLAMVFVPGYIPLEPVVDHDFEESDIQ